jgi:potassium-transporting ATPase KdpC subunit
MWQQIIPGLRIKLFMTLLFGIVYPLAITGICQIVFPHQANGSLVRAGGLVIGSELLGQNFTRPEYFQPRPSAAGTGGYDATASSGSNYGPTNKKLIERVKGAVENFRKANPGYTGPIPADLLTTSASGLDPHISPAAAQAQAVRIASARAVEQIRVNQLITQLTEAPYLGLLGEARVNVLRLNLALDQHFPSQR